MICFQKGRIGHRDAECFKRWGGEGGEFCIEFSRLSWKQKVTNERHFYSPHMEN